ncbi:MAG: hypothetical protein OSJ73_14235 [Lachnospiraceae bacterium]|jgi:flagellar basal-body rod modification protein FlgD|nr:hypothetical protein [Lachnospiraceae bacterium]
MGSLVAPFDEKGNLQTHTTSGDSLKKNEKNKNAVDSDMFLTLLVAEMQNQDPLEPTSNTEWVSQYATFTQVQKMSEMAEAVDVLRANELIGKEVIVKTTSTDTGEVNYKQGIVDFVEIENGKPLLVIDNAKYSISDLDTVVSTEYSQAYGKYSTFKGMIDSLPDVAYADKSYENVIQGAFDFYNTMNDYEKNYMAFYGADQMEKFTQWKLELENLGIEFKDSSKEEENKTSLDDILESFNTKMNAIIDKLNLLSNNSSSGSTDKTEQDSDNKTEDTDKTNDSDKTGNTDKTDGTNKTEGSDNTNTGDTSGSDNTDNTSGSDSTNTDNTTGSDSTNDSDNTIGSDSTNDSDNTTGSDNTSSADNTTGSDSTNNTGSTADSDSANNASNSDNADTHTT